MEGKWENILIENNTMSRSQRKFMCHLLWDLTSYNWTVSIFIPLVLIVLGSLTLFPARLKARLWLFLAASNSILRLEYNCRGNIWSKLDWTDSRMWNMNLIKAKMHICVKIGMEGHKNRSGSHYWDPLKPRWKIWSANYIKIEQ